VLTASRGKVQRAEPVSALYDQGKVRHVGHYPELERQYCLFSKAGYMGQRSPDHADAAIWGLTELMLDPEPVPGVRFFAI
jgi:phage terminase large subunit-like protein